MADVKGLVSDPSFQKLAPADQRKALAGVTGDQSFSNLSDDDTSQFVTKLAAPAIDPRTQQMNAVASAAGVTNPGISHPAYDPVLKEAQRYSSTLDPQQKYLYNLPPDQRPQAEENMSAGSSMAIPVGLASVGAYGPVGAIAKQGLAQGLKAVGMRAIRPLIGTAIGADAGERVGKPIGKLLGNEDAGATVGRYAGGAFGAGVLSTPDKLSEVPFLGKFLTTDDEYADLQAQRSLARQQAMERAVANNPDAQQRALGTFMNKGYQSDPYAAPGQSESEASSTRKSLSPLIYESEAQANQVDALNQRLKQEASNAGTYSAARGSVKKPLNYQQRIGRKIP